MDDLTLVISNKNRENNLSYCLESLSAQTDIPNVIVVDFGSRECKNWDKYAFVHTIKVTRNTGVFHKARALNIGLKNVKTKYTCFTDADQIFAPNFCSTLKNNIDEKAFVLCYTYNIPEPPEAYGVTITNFKTNYDRLLNIAKGYVHPNGEGCCQAAVTSWFLSVRGYDERYIGWGGEDSDMLFRGMEALNGKWLPLKQTSMIHLPHPVDEHYRSKALVDNNNKIFNNKRYNESFRKNIVTNINTAWGEL